jgi:hypothetical protein
MNSSIRGMSSGLAGGMESIPVLYEAIGCQLSAISLWGFLFLQFAAALLSPLVETG